jgi:hypothetical protein
LKAFTKNVQKYACVSFEDMYSIDTYEKGFTKDVQIRIISNFTEAAKRDFIKYHNKPVEIKSTNHQFLYRKERLLNLQIRKKLSCETVPL